MCTEKPVVRVVQECSECRIVHNLESAHDPFAVQIVDHSQRQASNVRHDIFELAIRQVELPFIGVNDFGNVLLRFQNHTVFCLVGYGVAPVMN